MYVHAREMGGVGGRDRERERGRERNFYIEPNTLRVKSEIQRMGGYRDSTVGGLAWHGCPKTGGKLLNVLHPLSLKASVLKGSLSPMPTHSDTLPPSPSRFGRVRGRRDSSNFYLLPS